MNSYVEHPPRKVQSGGHTGPVTISNVERLQWNREPLQGESIRLPLPTEN